MRTEVGVGRFFPCQLGSWVGRGFGQPELQHLHNQTRLVFRCFPVGVVQLGVGPEHVMNALVFRSVFVSEVQQ